MADIPIEKLWHGGAPFSTQAQEQALANNYRDSMSDPDSYASGLMDAMADFNGAISDASAGKYSSAKARYDRGVKFFADHSDDMSAGMAISNRSGNGLLEAIRKGSEYGRTREYDTHQVVTPMGTFTLGALFGNGGSYQQLRTEEIMAAHFSKDVADLVAGKTSDVFQAGDDGSNEDTGLKSLVSRYVVDPITSTIAKNGKSVLLTEGMGVQVSQRRALGAALVSEKGKEAMRAHGSEALATLTDHIVNHNMKDSTAVSMFKWGLDILDSAPDDVDKSDYLRQRLDAFEGLKREIAGASDGSVAGSASRELLMVVAGLTKGGSFDVDDPGTRAALSEIADVSARLERAGVPFFSLAQTKGVPVKDELVRYAKSRSQGVPAPENNYFAEITDLVNAAGSVLVPGWSPTPPDSKADPRAEVGKASGVFRATSGFEGLDSATVAIMSGIVTGGLRLKERGDDGNVAFQKALTDPEAVEGTVRQMSRRMLIPLDAARGIYTQLVKNMFGGTPDNPNAPAGRVGVENAVADFAFGVNGADDEHTVAMRKAAADWYVRNYGPSGKAYDAYINDAGIKSLLSDPVFGVGDKKPAEAQAYIDAYIQDLKKEMHETAARGRDPRITLETHKSIGRYYYVAGYIDNATGVTHEGLPPESDRTPARLSNYTPVIQEAYGPLDNAAQPVKNWVVGKTAIPAFSGGMYSRSRGDRSQLRSYQAFLQQLYRAQVQSAYNDLKKDE